MTQVTAHPDGVHAIDAGYIRPGLAAIHAVVQDGRAALVDTGTARSGHQVPPGIINSDLFGNRVDHLLVVSRNHNHPLNTQFTKFRNHFPCGFAWSVHQTDDPQVLVTLTDDHRRATITFEPLNRRPEFVR
jgi:hypothetical protein